MIELRDLNSQEYGDYIDLNKKNYTLDNIKSGRWSEEEASQKVVEQIKYLLPEGQNTEKHFFKKVVDIYTNERVGYLWYNVPSKDTCFVFDIIVDEEHRRKGYGRAIFQCLEEYLTEQHIKKIKLHVFGFNKAALALYQALGFEVASYNMKKLL
jgi:ribosomal protein S18 acetylase RimI-like enzyme